MSCKRRQGERSTCRELLWTAVPLTSTWTGCEPPPPPLAVETRIVATGMSFVKAVISSAI